MFDQIDAFRIASGLARHASERQQVLAQNIANANTPGYRALDVGDFATRFAEVTRAHAANSAARREEFLAKFETWRNDPPPMIANRPEDLNGAKMPTIFDKVDAPDETSPNGNTVSLEGQMVKSAAAASEHNLALTLYSTSIDFLRTAIGRGR